MAIDTIITAIKGLIETVEGVNKVYDYEPVITDKAYKDLLDDDHKLNVWMVTRTTSEQGRGITTNANVHGNNIRTHTITINGFYSRTDDGASELVFRELVEDILGVLRESFNLGLEDSIATEPPQLNREGLAELLKQYVVHHANITYRIIEYISY